MEIRNYEERKEPGWGNSKSNKVKEKEKKEDTPLPPPKKRKREVLKKKLYFAIVKEKGNS